MIDLKNQIEGDIFTDYRTRLLYATDASAYRDVPRAVALPKTTLDIQKIIQWAHKHEASIIPRTAGTSLAGQVVGHGVVVDVSKYMTNIIELNIQEKWVRVQPGVILDELNMFLKPHGLFFGPETSTSSRCMMGGMVGNNSCGSHSIIYGTTRDHTMEIDAILSDGSEVTFKPLTAEEFEEKCSFETLEGSIYRQIKQELSDETTRKRIRDEYPDPEIYRRNTGYAIDLVLDSSVYGGSENFNWCNVLAGSEGTLAFSTSIKLNLVSTPPPVKGLVCVHFHTLEEALRANLIALEHKPGAVELMDDIVLKATKDNISQNKNRFFLQGDPEAILMIEFARETEEEIRTLAADVEQSMRTAGLGYHFPLVSGNDIPKVWALRKAGLGVLSNIPGDKKPVTVIEDTAVSVKVLPDYIKDFKEVLAKNDMECVFYAHVGSGEIHLRPILNLKLQKDVERFHTIGEEIAKLVKKYRGSLSGEHGDGRLRGEFIPLMIGEENYELLKRIKKAWDPKNVFNPGKITDAPSMKENLRHVPDEPVREYETIFDFGREQGIVRAAELCNGSGDCRKTHLSGGTMCPSYMATLDESATTRARANILREYLIHSTKTNAFDHDEIYETLDLCLSCKACKSECPSSVDMAKLKAEFLQHYYDSNGIPLRTRAIAYISSINALGSITPAITNFFTQNAVTSKIIKQFLGFAAKRSIPPLQQKSLRSQVKKFATTINNGEKGSVYLFIDEFTNYNDTHIGLQTILLLNTLGYNIKTVKHKESGRSFLSKGLLRKARKLAIANVTEFSDKVSEDIPLVGIEPSTILSFRDEYPELVPTELREKARTLGKNALLFEEFFMREVKKGNITAEDFTDATETIKLHGHCQQKAVASTAPTIKMLSLPKNYTISEIHSGCCGMAGSFGYEKEHYDVSMKVGELVLFPAVRQTPKETYIAAPGTSCRHQIKDGTGRTAMHPIEIMFHAMK
ncbi:MAG: FAD-binding protein [Salinivirgaceae bacterium]|jgi:FAD/FMN-containing dehydrogenase/Fe-S oxidoreductase|nr:FAD-binding protein [Salinivirgaceae bacterium]